MKKIIKIAAVGALTLALSGCGTPKVQEHLMGHWHNDSVEKYISKDTKTSISNMKYKDIVKKGDVFKEKYKVVYTDDKKRTIIVQTTEIKNTKIKESDIEATKYTFSKDYKKMTEVQDLKYSSKKVQKELEELGDQKELDKYPLTYTYVDDKQKP